MGTTFSSIHVFSPNAVSGFPNFYSFSDGWQTYVPVSEPEDPFAFQKLAKAISQNINAPVLWFYIFDGESLMFAFYRNGRKVVSYSHDETKNLYGVPSMIGYEAGQKRRLSKILSCADIDYQVALLEEYFGVCLIPFPELMNEPNNALSRARGDDLYQAYLEEEKRLTGKQCPLKVELVFEQTGKLFHSFSDINKRFFRPDYCYFGYDTEESNVQPDALRPVCFRNGNLEFVTQTEFDAAPLCPFPNESTDDRYAKDFYPRYKIHFTDKAPNGFKNKTLVPPRGFYLYWFDEKGRAILSNERDSLAVVDDTLKVIAKIRVKGIPTDYKDGYILTVGSESFWAYYYNPSNAVRIYRLFDK